VKKALDTPEAKAMASKQGVELRYMGPEQLAALVQKDTDYWGKLIKARNIRAD
jgi:tripartite-type tricarboxylate transporter receptor subunit TctC